MQTQVPYGLVIYAGEHVRRVEYNEANRLWLHKVIGEVRMARSLPRVKRNHLAECVDPDYCLAARLSQRHDWQKGCNAYRSRRDEGEFHTVLPPRSNVRQFNDCVKCRVSLREISYF